MHHNINFDDLYSLISEIASKAAAEAVAAVLAQSQTQQPAPQPQRPVLAPRRPDDVQRQPVDLPFYLPTGWESRVIRTGHGFTKATPIEVLSSLVDTSRFRVVDSPTTPFHIMDWFVSREHPHVGAVQLGRALWMYDSGMWKAAKNDAGRFLQHTGTGYIYEVAWEKRAQGGIEAIAFYRYPNGGRKVHQMSTWLNGGVNEGNRGAWKTALSKFHILYWLLTQPDLTLELVRRDHKPQSVFYVWLGYVSEKWLDAGFDNNSRPRLRYDMERPEGQARFVFDVLGWEAPKAERPAPTEPQQPKPQYTPRPKPELVKVPHFNENGEQCGFWIRGPKGIWRYAMIIGVEQPKTLIAPDADGKLPTPQPTPQPAPTVDREEPPVEEDWQPEDDPQVEPVEDRAVGFNWTVIAGVGRKAHALLNKEGVTPELLRSWRPEQVRGFCVAAEAEHMLPIVRKAYEAVVDGLVIPEL